MTTKISDNEAVELRSILSLNGGIIEEMYEPEQLSSVKSPNQVAQRLSTDGTVSDMPLPNVSGNVETLGVIWELFRAAEEEFHAFFKADQEDQQMEAEEVLGSLAPEDNEATLTPAIHDFLSH
jgi:hypothetical protein